MKNVQSESIFLRRTIAALCMFEQMSAADDIDYMEDTIVPQFHAEEVDSQSAYIPTGTPESMREKGRFFIIADQYGNAAGCLSIYVDAATFVYSIITG